MDASFSGCIPLSKDNNGMSMLILFSLLALSLSVCNMDTNQSPAQPNRIVNGGFEHGFKGWTAEGAVGIETKSPIAGEASVFLGPGRGSVAQRYKVRGLRIIEFGATARFSSAKVAAGVRVKCLDNRGHILMDLSQGFDSKKGDRREGSRRRYLLQNSGEDFKHRRQHREDVLGPRIGSRRLGRTPRLRPRSSQPCPNVRPRRVHGSDLAGQDRLR
jgi:hypothetical protein